MLNPVVLLFAIPLGYIGMFVFGLPLYFLVRRFWRISALSSAVGGSLAGGLSGVAFSWWSNSGEASLWFASGIALVAAFGLVAGLSFWWLSRAQPALQAAGPASGGSAA